MGLLWWKKKPKAVGGTEARQRAERALDTARMLRDKADPVVASMHRIKDENHFRMNIENLIRKGHA